MITKKLLNSEGTLENTDKPGERVQSFTQKDIDDLKVAYHPPPLVASSEKEFVFKFVGKCFKATSSTARKILKLLLEKAKSMNPVIFDFLEFTGFGLI